MAFDDNPWKKHPLDPDHPENVMRRNYASGGGTSGGPLSDIDVMKAVLQRRLDRINNRILLEDGCHGVPLQIEILSAKERMTYLCGKENFVIPLREFKHKEGGAGPALPRPNDGYNPHLEYRDYNPLEAIKRGFDGASADDETSEGARWCCLRGIKFGEAHRQYEKETQIYQKELARRNKMGSFRRTLTDKFSPISAPVKSIDGQHAEHFLFVFEAARAGVSFPQADPILQPRFH